MQRETEEFEKQLASLRPKAPSAFLKARIAAKLEEEPAVEQPSAEAKPKLLWFGRGVTALVSAMAAVWVAILVLDRSPESPRMGTPGSTVSQTEDAPLFTVGANPIEQQATLVGAYPSPVFYLEDGTPAQQVTLRYLDTSIWKDDETGETISLSQYRDELRVVPLESF